MRPNGRSPFRRPGRTLAVLAAAILSQAPVSSVKPAGAVSVVRGPYLQCATPTSVVVRWRTDEPASSLVFHGPQPHVSGGGEYDLQLRTDHEIALTGLTPGTRYYYRVETLYERLVGGDSQHYFDTPPLEGSKEPIRIWVIGDSGTADFNAALVRFAYLAHPGSEDTDVWLMLGDNAYRDGTDAQYQDAVFEMYPMLLRNTLLWSTRGNHDDVAYYDVFTLPRNGEGGGLPSGTEAYYSFNYGNVHFVCLDSEASSRSPGGPMLTWLEQDLAANSQDWTIAFWHHPPYSKGSHDSDRESRLEEMRQNALPILEAGGVDLVMAGHSHSYERSFLIDGHYGRSGTLQPSMIVDGGDGRIDGDGAYVKPGLGPIPNAGAVYNVTGSSGKLGGGDLDHPIMVVSKNRLGSLVIDVRGDRLDAAFLETTGETTDHFTILKGTETSVPEEAQSKKLLGILRGAPNPFNRETTIELVVPRNGEGRVVVYDVTGRRLATLHEGTLAEGAHELPWDGRGRDGRRVVPGVYFAALEFDGEVRTKKLVRVR